MAIQDTIEFVEKFLGKEILSIDGKLQENFVNWVACCVVAATAQFHPSCDKIEPFFRKTWSKNFQDMEKCLSAVDVLETVTKHAATLNLDEDFRNTPVNTSNKNSFGAKRGTKEEDGEENKKNNKTTTKTGTPKASQNQMSSEMWQEYMKYPETTKKLPHQIDGMRKWCSSNSTCYRCYKEPCRKTQLDENSSDAELKAKKAKCIEIAKTDGYVVKKKKDNKDADKDGMQTTDDLITLPGVKQPVIPTSLQDTTKKTQTCTTKKQQPKETKTQEPKKKQKKNGYSQEATAGKQRQGEHVIQPKQRNNKEKQPL